MPVLLPAEIAALQGQSSTTAPIVLMEWLLPAPQYYSSREALVWAGKEWQGNRLKSFPAFTLGIFDRKGREFPKLDITISNLADDGSSAFPMQLLDSAQELENYPVKIYFYSPDAGEGFLRWAGYSGRPTYHGADKSVSLSCTFIFDSLNLPFPFRTQASLGFGTLDTNQNKANNAEPMIPLIFGDGPDLAVRPTIYRAWTEAGLLHVNFLLTGCNGFPLDASIITDAKLDGTSATVIEMGGLGTASQTAPVNLSRFPDGEAHPRVAYGYAAFPLPDDLKDSLDQLEPDAIKMWLENGRPLATTGAPSENHVLIIKDLLTDSYFGLGLSEADFDAGAVLAAQNYVGSRYRARLELHESMPLMDLLQKLLGDCHCYITFADKIQIRAKGNTEASVAEFATSDSGQPGRKIVNDFIEQVSEEDQSSVLNDLLLTYRRKNRHFGAPIHLYDPNSQSFTPGSINKPTREEIESISLQFEDEAKISGAILLREELNGNLFHRLSVPFWEGADIVPGDLITVHAVDIFGNASNYLFRVLTETFEPDASHISFNCKVYKPAIYNDDADGLGVDLLRGGQDTSQQGRPPDVTPVSLQVIDIEQNDTGGSMLSLQATCTIPAHDPAAEQERGVRREPPIAAVGCWGRYTNEPVNQARHLATIEVQQSTSQFNVSLEFKIDFHKNRSFEVFFVALPPSRSKSPLGFIRDTTKVTSLTAALSAAALTASVQSTTAFAVDDFVIIEKEFVKVLSKTANSLTFVNNGSARTAQLDSVSISHPIGIEVAVAKKSYPSLTLALIKRNTFLNVTGFAADQEDDGVRFHWDALEVDNLDYYLIYTCQDADALTNPAKLGSATPSWFLTNPESAPAIAVHRTKHKHYKVPATEIAANVTVAGRAAAKNTKGNYSSVLSSSATNKSTGHGAAPLFAPSDPATGDIISLGVPAEIAHKQIPVTFRIWANGADHTKKFDDGGIDRVGFFYAPPQAGDPTLPDLTRTSKRHQNITDTSQVSANVTHWFPLGQKLFWLGNFNANGSGKTLSANQAANVVFSPGDYSADPANLTTFTITATPVNAKYTLVDVHVVQPSVGQPVILKNLWFLRKLPTDGDYISQDDKRVHLHSDTSFSQLGADFHLFAEIKHPPGVTGISYRAQIVAQGGLSRTVTTSANSDAETGVQADTGVPATPGAPSFVRVKKNGTHVRMPLPASNRASHSHNLLVIASASAPANGVTVLTASDLTTGTVLSSANDAAGQIEAGRKKTTIEIDRAGLEAVFGAGATIHFWFYAVNDIGASLRSGSASYNLATGEIGALSADTAVPSTPGAPSFVRVKKNGTHVRMPLPASNRVSHSHNLLVIASASAPANGVTVLTASDLTTGTVLSSSNDAAGQIEAGRKKTTIEIDRAGLEAVFGAGVTIHFWFYAVNDIGPSLRSGSTSYNLATGEIGALSADTAVPSTPGATSFVKVKKNGTHVRMPLPASNRVSHSHNLLVIASASAPSNGVTVLTASDLTTGTVLSSSNDAAGQIEAGRKKTTVEIDRAGLEAVFGASATIHFWFYSVNDIGVSLRSGSTSYNLATGEMSAVGDDAAAPSGIAAPTIKKLKKSALKLDLTAPTTGNLRLRRANIYIANGDHSTATLWLSAADLTASTATESVGAIQTNPSGGVTIPIDRSALEAVFGAGATITVYATWTNDVGTSGFSSGTTYSLSSGEAGTGQVDIAVPSSLGTPNLQFIAKVGVHVDTMTVGTAWNQPKKKYLVIYKTTGPVYFDLPTYMSSGGATVQGAANEAAARYEFGPGKNQLTLGIRLADLKTVLGSTATMKAYFYAENFNGGTSAKSTDSNGIALATAKDIVSSRDAVNVIDIGVTLVPTQPMALNGDFFFNDGGANVNGWTRGAAASSVAIGKTTTDPIFWDDQNHQLKWINNSAGLLQNFKRRLAKNFFYSIMCALKTDGSFGSGTLTIEFVHTDDTTIVVAVITVNLNELTSSYQNFGGRVQLTSSFDHTTIKYFKMRTSTTLSSTNNIIVDKVSIVPGMQPIPSGARPIYEGDGTAPGGAENITLTTMNAVTPPDLGTPSGPQGGFEPGGGRIIPFTQ